MEIFGWYLMKLRPHIIPPRVSMLVLVWPSRYIYISILVFWHGWISLLIYIAIEARVSSVSGPFYQITWDYMWFHSTYFTGCTMAKSENFDLTLLMALLRNFTKIKEPVTTWNKMPKQADTSEGADLVRIRFHRNALAHNTNATLSNKEFHDMWDELKYVIIITLMIWW